MRGNCNWQDFNWHDASRGTSAIAELLVDYWVIQEIIWCSFLKQSECFYFVPKKGRWAPCLYSWFDMAHFTLLYFALGVSFAEVCKRGTDIVVNAQFSVKTWRHPQIRKYIIYYTVVGGGPSHGHRKFSKVGQYILSYRQIKVIDLTVILIIISFPSPTHLFIPSLKPSFFCKSFPPQPFPFFFRTDYMDSQTFTVTSEHIRFYFLVFLFYTF